MKDKLDTLYGLYAKLVDCPEESAREMLGESAVEVNGRYQSAKKEVFLIEISMVGTLLCLRVSSDEIDGGCSVTWNDHQDEWSISAGGSEALIDFFDNQILEPLGLELEAA